MLHMFDRLQKGFIVRSSYMLNKMLKIWLL
jgi:hypothetical protein